MVTWCLAAALAVSAGAQTSGDAPEADPWTFSASAFTFIVPEDDDYISPIVTADRDWLHLEGRYNYEGLDTASLWVGYNVLSGDETTWQITPMIGAVAGGVEGIAPGVEVTLAWKSIEFYTEGEYLIATDEEGDFLYFWSELTWAPTERFWFGLVSQRTRAYQSDLDIQRGVLAGVAFGNLSLTGHVFNPADDPIYVVAVGGDF